MVKKDISDLLSQGVDMRLAKICKGGCGNKPAMWIDGGNDDIHIHDVILLSNGIFQGFMLENGCLQLL